MIEKEILALPLKFFLNLSDKNNIDLFLKKKLKFEIWLFNRFYYQLFQ